MTVRMKPVVMHVVPFLIDTRAAPCLISISVVNMEWFSGLKRQRASHQSRTDNQSHGVIDTILLQVLICKLHLRA